MTFHFTADCTFEAKDLDDALQLLDDHFLYLMTEEQEGFELQFTGKMELKKT
jgi:hypothetical protein